MSVMTGSDLIPEAAEFLAKLRASDEKYEKAIKNLGENPHDHPDLIQMTLSERQDFVSDYYHKVDAVQTEHSRELKTVWGGLVSATDPIMRFIGNTEEIKNHYRGEAFALIEGLKPGYTIHDLDRIARYNNMCPVYRRYRTEILIKGILPSESAIQYSANGVSWSGLRPTTHKTSYPHVQEWDVFRTLFIENQALTFLTFTSNESTYMVRLNPDVVNY